MQAVYTVSLSVAFRKAEGFLLGAVQICAPMICICLLNDAQYALCCGACALHQIVSRVPWDRAACLAGQAH